MHESESVKIVFIMGYSILELSLGKGIAIPQKKSVRTLYARNLKPGARRSGKERGSQVVTYNRFGLRIPYD